MQKKLVKVYSYSICMMAWIKAMLITMPNHAVTIAATIFTICLSSFINYSHCYSPVFQFSCLFNLAYHENISLSKCKTIIDAHNTIVVV